MPVYGTVVLPAQQQQILGADDVAQVVILVSWTAQRLRANVSNLGDGGHLATIVEDQRLGTARLGAPACLGKQRLDRRKPVVAATNAR